MKIGVVQFDTSDIDKNMGKIDKFVKEAYRYEVELLIFPELANTGYILDSKKEKKLAEKSDGKFVWKIKEYSKKYKMHIIAGYLEKEDEKFYNSIVFTDDNGKILANYRKRYLWKKENILFEKGSETVVVDTEFGKIGLAICYDMEFPEPSREMALKGAKLICAPSCFSKRAENRWDIEMNANALFNLLFVAGANIVDRYCCGKSKIIGPDGLNIVEASNYLEELVMADIDFSEVDEIREKIPYFKDMDRSENYGK